MLLMVNSTHTGSGPVQGTSWWLSQISRSKATRGRFCASQVVWLMKPFGMLDSWFKISTAVYIIKIFWASGIGLVSGSPFAPCRSYRLTFVRFLRGFRIRDSEERTKDWVGVRAKFGRKLRYLSSLDIRRRGRKKPAAFKLTPYLTRQQFQYQYLLLT